MHLSTYPLRVSLVAVIALLVFAPATSHGEGVSFSTDLHYGMHSTAVGQLQDFLRGAGYFHDDTSDNFLSETRAAVRMWQAANCIPSTGYFGALSRQAMVTGSFCVSTAATASSTPASVSTTSSATDGSGLLVVLNGKYYIRTTNGLMLIHGGVPRISPSETAPAPAPAPTYRLSISQAGSSGSGTVTSSPAGIMCGASCSASYSPGTTITLTAVAAGDSAFFGWSGGGCSGTGTCTVTVNADTTVSAIFPINLSLPPPDLSES